MVGPFVRLLRVASIVICMIVLASFAIFVYDQTSSASAHQTRELTGEAAPASAQTTKTGHESAVHEAIDEASEQLTSPFSGIVSSASSEWLARGVKLALALIVYGFGLGYLARVLRVRV